jgi:CheY-like chemotaxis protein
MIPETNQVKVLIVDDLDENLLALEVLLESDDLQILLARSGNEALELLLVHEVALALVDVQMPEMDGFSLAELMRGSERTKRIPIILLTAGARDQQRVFRGYDAGAVDFLFKPVEPAILKNKVQTFVHLHRQRLELEETLRMNETFMAVLGHDLRSPVSTVVSTAALLEAQSQEPATIKAATRLKGVATRMQRMISDLLDVARARQGGGIPVTPRSIDLVALVRRAVDEQHAIHPQAALQVSLPATAVGHWDEDRISQALCNLISNAIDHGSGGPITVSVAQDGDQMILTVSNRGAISADVLPVIFDPFRSLARSRSGQSGLGLGLFIVQQIAQAHGGFADVTSRQETVVFRLALPIQPPAGVSGSQARAPMERAPRAAARPAPVLGLRILIVDDNDDLGDVMRELLLLVGHKVEVARDGLAAVDLARIFSPQVVLTDIELPGIDGYEVARRLRAMLGREVMLVAATGYDEPGDRRRAEQAGFDAHLAKPIQPEVLDRLLAQARDRLS